MLLPPAETVPFTVEILKDPVDWQLLKLENGFKHELGEEALTKSQQEQLRQAVLKEFPAADIRVAYIGPVIGAHTGPGMLALIYWGANR